MQSEHLEIPGPAGRIELFVDTVAAPKGLALIAHPHPLFGGTAENKVVTTLAKAFRELHCVSVRPQFRGVGGSEGQHDQGEGETDDLLAVLAWARRRYGQDLPVYLAGFSFGAYVVTKVAERLSARGTAARRLVLVGAAAGEIAGLRRYETAAVPRDTIVIHGGKDETVPLVNVLAWAEPLDVPVIVIPGADHFFHRRLHLIRDLVKRLLAP
ncbi:MAG: alpha/beta fold hydrolase [Rhodocyclaceae bacterium]|nr:alpha/beta fold hydrolase [Rhodocyclaceae bacterium]